LACPLANARANELLYSQLNIANAVTDHQLAINRGPMIGFGCSIVSATRPFQSYHLAALARDAVVLCASSIPIARGYTQRAGARGWIEVLSRHAICRRTHLAAT